MFKQIISSRMFTSQETNRTPNPRPTAFHNILFAYRPGDLQSKSHRCPCRDQESYYLPRIPYGNVCRRTRKTGFLRPRCRTQSPFRLDTCTNPTEAAAATTTTTTTTRHPEDEDADTWWRNIANTKLGAVTFDTRRDKCSTARLSHCVRPHEETRWDDTRILTSCSCSYIRNASRDYL